MTAITGLFLRQEDALRAVSRLPLLGIEGDAISILRTRREVREHLDCSQRRPIRKYAALGALIAIAVFGFFAMLDCRTAIGLGIDPDLAVAETTAFALGGTLVGAFMGSLWGRDKAERETHLYLEGVRCGYLLLMVQAPEHRVAQTLNILAQQGGFRGAGGAHARLNGAPFRRNGRVTQPVHIAQRNFPSQRLMQPLGDIPPAEYEALYYQDHAASAAVGVN